MAMRHESAHSPSAAHEDAFVMARPSSDVLANPADALFQSLDGLMLPVLGRVWLVEVFGIHDLGNARWLQIGLHEGATSHLVTQKISFGGSLREASKALSAWVIQEETGRTPVGVGQLLSFGGSVAARNGTPA